MKKNCYNCQHLEYIHAEDSDSNGFDCAKRNDCTLTYEQETELHNNLDREAYREKAKRCCELKPKATR